MTKIFAISLFAVAAAFLTSATTAPGAPTLIIRATYFGDECMPVIGKVEGHPTQDAPCQRYTINPIFAISCGLTFPDTEEDCLQIMPLKNIVLVPGTCDRDGCKVSAEQTVVITERCIGPNCTPRCCDIAAGFGVGNGGVMASYTGANATIDFGANSDYCSCPMRAGEDCALLFNLTCGAGIGGFSRATWWYQWTCLGC